MRLLRPVTFVLVVVALLPIVPAYAQVRGHISWKPPLIPVEITLDSSGNISVSSSGSWVTPIGQFTAGIDLPLKEQESVLTLLVDGHESRYKIGAKKLDVSVSGLRLLRLINDGEGNVTVIASRDLTSYGSTAPTAPALIGEWQGGYFLNGYPMTEIYYFRSDGIVQDRSFDQYGREVLSGFGRYEYSNGGVTIYWNGGTQERGAIDWASNDIFHYRIVAHSFTLQIGLGIVFRRLSQ